MVIKIVVGANFGDEGKGLMTDYFCRQSALRGEKCLVVLHNGGAQRGHTVVTPEEHRHVFHHFGSGTFAGADTYLSGDFILNPMVFRQEWEELEKISVTPMVYVNYECRVTTPFDMILNQILEGSRGSSRHGSCGMGIQETIIRDVYDYPCEIWMNSSDKTKRYYLEKVRLYAIERLKELGIEAPEGWSKIIYSDVLIENFISDLNFVCEHIFIIPDNNIIGRYDCAVFENGQGLLLDQNNKEYFPHLTPSNTGVKNPLEIIAWMQCIDDVEVCYVTRTYLTRHGAGRLDGECDKSEINPDMQDLTNVPNPHQGTLRYAKLDKEALTARILKDFRPARLWNAELSLAITHTNEFPFEQKFDFADKIYESDGECYTSVQKV